MTTPRDWSALIGQDVCITTGGETICGLVVEIMHLPDVGEPQALTDEGWAITLRADTTWEPVPQENAP